MSVILSPLGGAGAQFLNNNGVILSGGKLFTYAAGADTLQSTYTTVSGVTPHTNPIILDSSGRVPGGEIWFTSTLSYKVVVKDANNVLIGTYDNLTGADASFIPFVGFDGQTGTVSDLAGDDGADWIGFQPSGGTARSVQSKLRDTVSVKDFGAVGDGIADDTQAIQDAIDASSSVYFPEGTYLLNSGIIVGANVRSLYSNGATIKRGNLAATYLLRLVSDEIVIDGLIVDGNDASFTVSNPSLYIDVLTTNNQAIITNCVFKNACGTSIGGQANGIQITGCSFDEWLDHAIYFSGTQTPTNATSIIVNNNSFKHGNGSDNGCIKFRNNVANATVDSNVFALQSSTPFVQDDQGGILGLGDGLTYFNKRIVISNNSGECVYFYGKATDTPVADVLSTKSVTTLEGNSVYCTFFVSLGTLTKVSIGDLNILNNSVQGVLLWFRNIDNTDYQNTIKVEGNTVFGDFIVCENTMPSRLLVNTNRFSITTFFIANNLADADTSGRVVEIVENDIVKTGTALSSLIDLANLQQNTAVYVVNNYIQNVSFITNSMGNGPLAFTVDGNISTGGAVTTSNSQEFTSASGSLVISNNTFGGRLMLENANAKSSCMLTRYSAYIFGNRTDNVSEVVYTFGTPVTSYAGSNRFYSEQNFGLNCTVSNGYSSGVKAALPTISL